MVMVPPGYGLPVGNSCKCMVCIFKEKFVYFVFLILIKAGKGFNEKVVKIFLY